MRLTLLLAVLFLSSRPLLAAEPKDSPAVVYAAYQKALAAGDGKAALACLTERQRDHHVFEMVFGSGIKGDEELYEKYRDQEREAAWKKKHGEPGKDNARRFVTETMRDPEAFFSEGLRKYGEHFINKEPLRDVKVDGERARGVVTNYIESISQQPGGVPVAKKEPYNAPIYFAKTKGGWKIDLPNEKEAKAEVKQKIGLE